MRAMAQAGIPVQERAFTVAEAKSAREAFFTSATGNVMPVVRIDEQAIGNGHPGSLTQRIYAFYRGLPG